MKLLNAILGFTVGHRWQKEVKNLIKQVRLGLGLFIAAMIFVIFSSLVTTVYYVMQIMRQA